MSDNQRYQEFLVEAEDIIHRLGKNLSQLQVLSASSKDINPDIVSDLFGGIHTLKGLSSMVGFEKISALSHKLEDLLENLRSGQIELSAHLVDTLSEGVDMLTRLLTNISDQGGEYLRIDPLLDKIGKTMEVQVTRGDEFFTAPVSVGPDVISGLSDYEAHRLMDNVKQGASAYRIRASFSVDTIDGDIARLQVRLTRCGEVIAFIPASGFSAEKCICFDVIFATKEVNHEEDLSEIIKGEKINIQGIESFDIPRDESELINNNPPDLSAKGITRTLRVGIESLDALLNNAGEISLLNDTIFQTVKGLKTHSGHEQSILDLHKTSKELCKRLSILRHDLIEIRMVPISQMFDRLTKVVEKVSKDLHKDIRIESYGGDNKLGKAMIEGLVDPLMHIIRNAVDHGIEEREVRLAAGKPGAGTICLRAFQKEKKILIEIEDDGGGIDFKKIYSTALEMDLINQEEEVDEKRLIKFLFQPHFSTREIVNEVSGRGVGLDVVAKSVAGLGGMIDVDSRSGKGAKFSIIIPLTLLIARALIVSESGRGFAIPFNTISENFILKRKEIKSVGGREVFNVRGSYIPLFRLRDIFRFTSTKDGLPPGDNKEYVIVVGLGEKRAGIVVEAIEEQREILLKPLSELLGSVPGIAGFTEIDTKRILPVIDVRGILESEMNS